MRAALLIFGKDLRQRLRDRSALLVAIVVPLVLASIFGLVFHNAVNGRVTIHLGLVDQDRGTAARALEATLGQVQRQGLLTLSREATLAAGRSAADRNTVAATIVVPPGFSAAALSARPAGLRVIGSVDATLGTQVAESIAQSFADQLDTVRLASAAAHGARLDPARLAALQPIAIADVSAASRQLDAGTFYAAGMAVFFLFFTVQFGVSSILDERREGTLARIMAAPVPRRAVLVGKLLTSLTLGTASMTVLALATHFLLSAHWGNAAGVAILIVAGVLAATAVMALVATFARTPDQAATSQSMVALVLGMLGGTFFPVAQAGGVLAALSLATPQAWFLRGIENLTGGAGPSAVAGPAAAILAFAAVMGTAALLRAGRLVAR